MTTPGEVLRKSSARSFAATASRFPMAVSLSALPGVVLPGSGEKISTKSTPGKSGIDDGFTGIVRVPWYQYDPSTRAYSDPFDKLEPEDVERGTVTVNGVERNIVNVALNALRTILEIKLGGRFDG